MHASATQHAALDLIEAGVNDCEIARRLGVPRTSLRIYRRASVALMLEHVGVKP